MPPQQDERLLDLGDDCFGFGTHIGDQLSEVRDQENRGQVSVLRYGVSTAQPIPEPDI